MLEYEGISLTSNKGIGGGALEKSIKGPSAIELLLALEIFVTF